MKKIIILFAVIGIIVIGGVLTYDLPITIEKDPSKESFKIGIVQWVTNEEFKKILSHLKNT